MSLRAHFAKQPAAKREIAHLHSPALALEASVHQVPGASVVALAPRNDMEVIYDHSM